MTATILAKLNQLPSEKLIEVTDFVEFLLEKSKNPNVGKVAKFGSSRGKYKMAPDFEAPLENFKEYMQ
jgi:hypothetical protein